MKTLALLVYLSAFVSVFADVEPPLVQKGGVLDGIWGGGEMDVWRLILASDGRAFFNASFMPSYATWTKDGTNTVIVDLGGIVPFSANMLMATNRTERFVYDASTDIMTWMSPHGKKRGQRLDKRSGGEIFDAMIKRMREALQNRPADWRDPVVKVETKSFRTPEELIAYLKTCDARFVSFAPQANVSSESEFMLHFCQEQRHEEKQYEAYVSHVAAKYHFGDERFRDMGVTFPKVENIGITGNFPTPYWSCNPELEKAVKGIASDHVGQNDQNSFRIENYGWMKDVESLRLRVIGEFKASDVGSVFTRIPSRLFPFPCQCLVKTKTFVQPK